MSCWIHHEGHPLSDSPEVLRWLWDYAAAMQAVGCPVIIGWN